MMQKYLLAIMTILSLAVLHITQIFTLSLFLPTILALGLLLVMAVWLKSKSQLPCLLLLFLASLVGILPAYLMSPIFPVAISLIIAFIFPTLRANLLWLRLGKIDRTSWLLGALTIPASILAIILWAQWSDFLGGGAENIKQLENLPKWTVFVLVIPLFAITNALAEELFYRGIVQDALTKGIPNFWAANIIQALAFGAAHFARGFPNGYVGLLMTFIWALMLGYLRQRTQGLLLPFLIHVAADAIIASLLAIMVL